MEGLKCLLKTTKRTLPRLLHYYNTVCEYEVSFTACVVLLQSIKVHRTAVQLLCLSMTYVALCVLYTVPT